MRGLPALVSVLLLIVGLQGASADTLAEAGDAGDLPGTAQSSRGAGAFGAPLTAISGTVASSSDQDMFEIYISDPHGFSASTNNAGTNLTADGDTQLFLFDSSGFGLLMNDDAAGTPTLEVRSTIPAGSFAGTAGRYFLAISIFDNDPISVGGAIFPDEPSDEVLGPDGPGGSSRIDGWMLSPDPAQTGAYRIDLTGATFVPEPSTALLLGGGLFALGSRQRRHRR